MSFCQKTLFQILLDQLNILGRNYIIAEDITKKPLSYGQLVTHSFVLGHRISKATRSGKHVGIMLPNMVKSITVFFSLQAYGRIPTMINFSVGSQAIISACKTAQLKTIYSSRKFVETANLINIVEVIKKEGINIVYLEDVVKSITIFDKLRGLIFSYSPRVFYKKTSNQKPDDTAVILFTSGSEGSPKGVALSHINIHANCTQLASCVEFKPVDVIFSVLPIFHSFGLTCGVLLPLFSGFKVFLYHSPLHYQEIPELICKSNATILFGTDTLLSNYTRFANIHDFYSIRYVFAGAEKLKETTRTLWLEKYGINIFEGYGTTETAPVLSVNTPTHNKRGTVGRLLPSIDYILENVPGIEDGGRLFVSGANIMKGYLFSDNPGVIIPPKDGKHDTGDIVSFDEDGYIIIKGRAKRFAKIAGEMISLTAVEAYLFDLWPESYHAVISIPDDKKGELLVLITDYQDASREEISAYIKLQGIGTLFLPRIIRIVDEIPLLGTGKTDYTAVQDLYNK
ncbi:AMP-binding protein [Pseudomonadota bacterium]